MDPLVKRLLIIGVLGLIATWGTFLALELTPQQDEELEPLAREPAIERRPRVSANKRLEQQRNSRIAAAKRRKPVQKPAAVRPPAISRSKPPPAPQQKATIEVPNIPELPRTIPSASNPSQARFNQLEKVYESEIRDSVWADEKEKRILDLFKKGNYEETLIGVSCRKTLCRMEVRLDSPDMLYRLLAIPGLAPEIGTTGATQPLGEGKMVSFIVRKGTPH